jgi:DNA-binding LacI/PurR family transcriptional regulator
VTTLGEDDILVKGLLGEMKHPTMEEVAREAGVSRALVSLVFRDSPRVAETSKARVLAAAEQLGYRPNAMARGLASRADRTVAVLIRDLHNPFFAEILDGIEELAEREGVRLLLGHAGPGPRELSVLDALLEFRPAGLVLLSPDAPSAVIAEHVQRAPVVVVGRPVRRAGMDTVVNDDVRGASIAVQHLAGLGHRHIAHVSGGRRAAGTPQRIRGYEQTMRRLGLGAHVRVVDAGSTEQAGMDAVDKLVGGPLPTAVFAFSDLVAIGMLSALDARGIRVPEDVSLVGYDNTLLARLRHVGLTTVDQPRRAMGRQALTRLLERISGQRTRSVLDQTEPSLVVRTSSGPPRPNVGLGAFH